MCASYNKQCAGRNYVAAHSDTVENIFRGGYTAAKTPSLRGRTMNTIAALKAEAERKLGELQRAGV